MARLHRQLNGHEFEQTLSLACHSSRACKESDVTWQLNNNIGFKATILVQDQSYWPYCHLPGCLHFPLLIIDDRKSMSLIMCLFKVVSEVSVFMKLFLGKDVPPSNM